MLVLTRAVGESVVIGDGSIVITVLRITGGQVRIGIEAPRELDVHRMEVREQRQRDPIESSRT